jgi:hypothetical protein
MTDKLIEDVVEQAKALRKVAIENAKTELMNELAPKFSKILDEKIDNHSKKLVEQEDKEDNVEIDVTDEPKDEAEIDLDDLAKEIDKDEEGGDESSVEDRLDSLEQKVDDVKEDVAELKGEEETESDGEEEKAPEDEEEIEIEDDSDSEDEIEDLGESVDINVHDNDVIVNVEGEDALAAPEVPPSYDDDEMIEIEDDSEVKNEEQEETVHERRIRTKKESIMRNKRRIREQANLAQGADAEDGELVDIVDDENWNDAEAPDKVDWEKNVAKLERVMRRNRVLEGALRKASRIITRQRVALKEVQGNLNETTLLNKKLVLVNKIFSNHELNRENKVKVLTAFDKAVNIKESVVVYNTILESLNKNKKETPKKVEKIQESMKKSEQKVLKENTSPQLGELPQDRILEIDRMKKLAGIED